MASKVAKPSAELNPRTTTYEFLGPPGALLISLGVPAMTYMLYFGCSEQFGGCPPPLPSIHDRVIASIGDPQWWYSLWDTEAAIMYLGWYAFCVLSWLVLPGEIVEGTTLRTGDRKKYKCNGMYSFNLILELHSLTYLPSVLNLPPHVRHRDRRNIPLWPSSIYFCLRQMGGHCYSFYLDVCSPGSWLLPQLFPSRALTGIGREFW